MVGTHVMDYSLRDHLCIHWRDIETSSSLTIRALPPFSDGDNYTLMVPNIGKNISIGSMNIGCLRSIESCVGLEFIVPEPALICDFSRLDCTLA